MAGSFRGHARVAVGGELEAVMGAVILGPERPPGNSPHRIGLVLGAGGVLGAAWMTGALPSLQDRLPRTINDVDVMVGTSAGSVLAAALRCGAGIDEIAGTSAARSSAYWPALACR